MKKKGFAFGLMAVLAAAVLVLAGCGGPKAEDVIREGVTAEVDPTNVTEDDLLKMGGQLFMDITDNAEMRDVEFTLSVEKDSDGNWGFADGAEDEIYEMLLG